MFLFIRILYSLLTLVMVWHCTKCVIHSKKDVDAIVEAEISNCQHKAGLGVVVVSRNNNGRGIAQNLSYTKAFGFKNIEEKTLADEDTMFCIGSLTKHFTTTLILHLLELMQKKGYRQYSLQSPITEIDPALNFSGSQFVNTTLEDIMSHRTGIAEVFGQFWVGYHKNVSRQNLTVIAAKLPRLADNRAKYIYNNHVFTVAGHVAEILGEVLLNRPVSWEELVQKFLFDPLRINSLVKFAGNNFSSGEKLATPYLTKNGEYHRLDDNVLTLIEPAGPAGSLCMSPKAMKIWMDFLIERGYSSAYLPPKPFANYSLYKRMPIVSPSSITETWEPRVCFPSHKGLKAFRVSGSRSFTMNEYIRERREHAGYGLGWIASKHRGYRSLDHSGGFYNYLSLLSVFPDQNISIFTSSAGPYTTTTRNLLWRVHYNIFDHLMGLPPSIPEKCINHSLSPVGVSHTNKTPVVKVDVKNYAGTYYHPVHGLLAVETSAEPASGLNLIWGAMETPVLSAVHRRLCVNCASMEFCGGCPIRMHSEAIRDPTGRSCSSHVTATSRISSCPLL
ncbi:uncharacterized protein LOC129593817 [Paramacrobiotus metropolitanus]|uniref:uncharacterized protein LOC129593817 n=1 Tax=Paramacrobiotus metropolitanus TaxID=2943436 RepID=UPI002445908C|nr:uncharacterized protein LOC129593817 [Paramacrobiotus metropolitanus]